MYIPSRFAAPDESAMYALMQAHPLAALVTHAASGLAANHIPLNLSGGPAPHGVLQGHLARANTLLADIAAGGIQALAIFSGPQTYVTPSWYATKPLTGKVVPTWNYVVVHVHGVLRVVEDASWLQAQITALTAQSEAAFAHPWAVTDAPADYIEKSLRAIVGIEMTIDRIEGKWKVSQNQSASNQAGVVAGLQAVGSSDAQAMADLVLAHGDKASSTA